MQYWVTKPFGLEVTPENTKNEDSGEALGLGFEGSIHFIRRNSRYAINRLFHLYRRSIWDVVWYLFGKSIRSYSKTYEKSENKS